MPVVACPKCKTKFKLSSEQLGKAVRCNSCQTKFRTAAPATAGKAAPKKAGASKAPAKPVAAPPAKKKPRTLEEELFSSAPIKPGTPDPLGNFVLEDPGFGAFELPEPEDDGDSDEDLFADRQHLMNNPALKGRNPYSSPSASGGSKGGQKNAKQMRKRLLPHESEVKCLGMLNMMRGVLLIVGGIGLLVLSMVVGPDSTIIAANAPTSLIVITGLLAIILGGTEFAIGWFLNNLMVWAKIVSTIFLIPTLFGFPFGTAFSGYFLWVLHSEKGKEVFSQEYRDAVRATPDMKTSYKTLFILVGLFVGLIIGMGVVGAVMQPRQ